MATYAVNELGDWMGVIALSVLVFDRTGSALATTGLFIGTGFVPGLVAPILVTRIEKPPPRVALPLIYCGEAATFGALALLAKDFSLAPVVVLAAIDGALAIAGRALTRAVVAATLEPFGELRAGNAILNMAFTGGAAAGPALAGMVVGSFGVQTALLLDAASFYVIACILVGAGPIPRAEPEPGATGERFRAGLAYIREKVVLRRLLIAQGTALIFFSAVIPVEVVFAKQTLGVSDSGYGLMLASWGSGMVIGSIVFAALRRVHLAYPLLLGTIAVGAGYVGLSVAPTLAFACLASALGGAGNGVQWVALVSTIQEMTVPGMQARVMSVLEATGAAMPGIGFVLGGVVASVATPRATFLMAGLGVFGIVAFAVLLLSDNLPKDPAIRASRRLDGGNDIVLELIVGGSPVHSDPGVAKS